MLDYSEWLRKHQDNMLASYRGLLSYWQGRRMNTSWQTPEFVAERIAQCEGMVAKYEAIVSARDGQVAA